MLKLPIFPPVYKTGTGHKGSGIHLARIYTEDVMIGFTVSARTMAGDTIRSKGVNHLGGMLL